MLTDFMEIRADLDAKKAENLKFVEFFTKIGSAAPFYASRSISALAKAYANEIDCTKCGNCCRFITIHINAEDRRRLAKWLKLQETDFISRYCRKTDQGWAFTDHQCPFLEKRQCLAYEVRPHVCRQYPHLDLETMCLTGELPVNMTEMIKSAYRCPIIYNVFEELKTVYAFHAANGQGQAQSPETSTGDNQTTAGGSNTSPTEVPSPEPAALE